VREAGEIEIASGLQINWWYKSRPKAGNMIIIRLQSQKGKRTEQTKEMID
jgi:hypothetical protein